MPTRNINLTDRYDRFIEEGIASGRYKNASEVVRAGLRLLEQHESEKALKLERLRRAVQLGLEQAERGESAEIDLDRLDEDFDELEAEAAARKDIPSASRS